MPEVEKNDTIIYCCCIKKSVLSKESSYSKINYSQLQETLKVPYIREVPKDLVPGSIIHITGKIQPKCTRLAIDLVCRKENHTNIAFHFNPRLDRHYVVRNARVGERWGIEEAASTSKCDLTRNENFNIIFLITDKSFLVSINGIHFCEFKFRVPFNLITHVEVAGDVDVFSIKYEKWDIYPKIESSIKHLLLGLENAIEPSKELLEIPCTANLPGGFEEGCQLEIYGRVKLLPYSFYINLQDGSQIWPHPNIPLHLNPRFRSVISENVIVRNAWVDGHWGIEEQSPTFPFSPGEPFCVAIRRSTTNFELWIDGQLNGEFRFRFQSKISSLVIQGDIVLKKIALHKKYVELPKPEVGMVKL